MSCVLRNRWRAVRSPLSTRVWYVREASPRHPLLLSVSHLALLFESPLSLGVYRSPWGQGMVTNLIIITPCLAVLVLGWSPMKQSLGHPLSLLRTLPGPLGLTIWKMGDLLMEGKVLSGKIRCPSTFVSSNPAGFWEAPCPWPSLTRMALCLLEKANPDRVSGPGLPAPTALLSRT